MRRNVPDPDSLTTPEAVRAEEEVKAAHRGTVKVYWMAFTIIASIALAVLTIATRREQLLAPFIALMLLPGGQLPATLVTALWIRLRPPARKSEAYKRLIRITVFGFLGALLGVIGVVITFLTMGM